jgi:hypothetical protein
MNWWSSCALGAVSGAAPQNSDVLGDVRLVSSLSACAVNWHACLALWEFAVACPSAPFAALSPCTQLAPSPGTVAFFWWLNELVPSINVACALGAMSGADLHELACARAQRRLVSKASACAVNWQSSACARLIGAVCGAV